MLFGNHLIGKFWILFLNEKKFNKNTMPKSKNVIYVYSSFLLKIYTKNTHFMVYSNELDIKY